MEDSAYYKETFCTYVEFKTKNWADMRGASSGSFRHGIFFSHDTKEFRFWKKWGKSSKEAFRNVRHELIRLIQQGESLNFEKIHNNKFCQTFKAKVLSLYFPDLYLPVCSGEHIKYFAQKFRIKTTYLSERQHLLVSAKLRDPKTKDMSSWEFMRHLYTTYPPPKK